MPKLITFKTDKSGITIRIPKSLLSFVAKNHPETPVKIKDGQKFMEQVAFELENIDSDHESGNTFFQDFIDNAISEATINKDYSEFKEDYL